MAIKENKKLLLNSLAKLTRKLRGDKSQFKFCNENGISQSVISLIERGKKDPQLTTIFKLAEAFDLKAWQFVKLIEEDLPENFSLIDE